MKSVIVLGAGMVGKAMARDLAGSFAVTAADVSAEALQKLSAFDQRIQTVQADLSDEAILRNLVAPFDLVLSAVPGFMGYQTLERLLHAGKHVVDISFFPEDALQLHALAASKGLTAITDCGVAPGMDNIILGYYDTLMKVDFFECIVGGLPKVRTWPFQYKAPFSPVDVLEEYTRPARYVENGHIIVREALSDPEFVQFEKAGTLESFNTDGLRSLIFTMKHIPDMKEKTLRYPGHIEYVRVLRETGFLSTTPMDIKGVKVSPMDLTSKLLFAEWKLGDTEPEFTVMRVTVRGEKDGRRMEVVTDLYDEYDAASQTSSMARTTGYTATAAIHLLADGVFTEKGVFPPELVGRHAACYQHFMAYLKARNVVYDVKERMA